MHLKRIEFEIEIEKRVPYGQQQQQAQTRGCHPTTTSVHIESSSGANSARTSSEIMMQPKITTCPNTGRVSIENISTSVNGPTSEITIKSDFGVGGGPSQASHQITATRMSSGYFSGDEFRSYYANSATNYYDFGLVNSQSPTLSSSTTMDTAGSNTNSSSSTTGYQNYNNNNNNNNYQFNPSRFLSNSSKAKLKSNDDAIDDLNRMYKSIGLAEEEDIANGQTQRFSSSSSFSNQFGNNCSPGFADRLVADFVLLSRLILVF